MPQVKIPKSSPSIDMTPMVDLGFLLVTFFMLTTIFRADEPVTVTVPSSISDIKLPEADVMLITVDDKDRVFYTFDGQQHRKAVLAKMSEKYKVTFTEEETHTFAVLNSFGVPMAQMKDWLALPAEERKKQATGIPCDTLKNELADWILYSRLEHLKYRVAIKGDQLTNYEKVKFVISTLQDKKVNKFNLVTNLEQ